MVLTEAQKRAKEKYNQNIKKVSIELHKAKDLDIINKLEEIGSKNKSSYIKDLIRQDIKKDTEK